MTNTFKRALAFTLLIQAYGLNASRLLIEESEDSMHHPQTETSSQLNEQNLHLSDWLKAGVKIAVTSALVPAVNAACNLGDVKLDSSVVIDDDTCVVKSASNPIIGISTASLSVAAVGLIYSSRPDGLIGKAWKHYIDPQLEKWDDYSLKSVLLSTEYDSVWDRIQHFNFTKIKDFPNELFQNIKFITNELKNENWSEENLYNDAHQTIGFTLSHPILKISFEKVNFVRDHGRQSIRSNDMSVIDPKDKIDEFKSFIPPYLNDKFNVFSKKNYDSFFELVASRLATLQSSTSSQDKLAINFNIGLRILFTKNSDYDYSENRTY